MLLNSGDTLLFTGDSVTDDWRARPIGDVETGLGNGYVNIVNSILTLFYPTTPVRVLNTGVGGDTIRMLKARWQTDVLDLKPDWLSICIGINDVWRQIDGVIEEQVLPDEYLATYEELITKTKPGLKGLVLMSPYYIESDKNNKMRARMDEYTLMVKGLAEKYGAIYVDLQAAYDEFLANRNHKECSPDQVHPNNVGAFIMANAFLKAIGFDMDKAKG